MDLRLIEQACGCSAVRDEGRLKVCACSSSASGTRMESGRRHHDEAPAVLVSVFALSHHGAPTDRASLRLLHGARQRRSLGACASLPGATITRHLQVFAFALQPP